jgi:hypothetical protein
MPSRRVASPLASVVLLACGHGGGGGGDDGTGNTTATASSDGGSETSAPSTTAVDTTADSGPTSTSASDTDATKFDFGGAPDMPRGDCFDCASDFQSVVTCGGALVEACGPMQGCDLMSHSCIDACTAAANNQQSVGCEYYATFMQHWDGPGNRCFVAFVANTWNSAAHLQVEYEGAALPVESFTRIPSGAGPGLTYGAYDDAAGLAPGEVAILFLSGPQGPGPACPTPSAVPDGVAVTGTGFGESFRIVADVPVVAYQMNPYGGGSAAVTGASLLLPTSAWDTNYVVVNPLPASNGDPTANIIAAHDGTTVTLQPSVALAGGGGVPGGPADVAVDIPLDRAQHLQLTQDGELTGSIIQADAPVGLMGGHTGMLAPVGTYYSDHAEQMIPPVRSLGSEYVGVMHRPRVDEPSLWRVVGVVDGTVLSWSSDVGGPAMLDRGDRTEFITDEPFVVTSQDADHPFVLLDLMSGSQWQPSLSAGYGDSDFVLSVPPDQWMPRYVFFTDPTYPETNLVVIRRPSQGQFADVELDCYGSLDGWQSIGSYEWTRVDLVTGDFEPVGACDNGRHEMTSAGRFGLWVWGWGTPLTTTFTSNVSYGYPGGMNVQPINDVVLDPEG